MLVAVRLDLEATGGFEPPNRAFAELRLNHLATSPYNPIIPLLVPRKGLEPLQVCTHGPLKTACLPIPPPRLYSCQSLIKSLSMDFINRQYMYALGVMLPR